MIFGIAPRAANFSLAGACFERYLLLSLDYTREDLASCSPRPPSRSYYEHACDHGRCPKARC